MSFDDKLNDLNYAVFTLAYSTGVKAGLRIAAGEDEDTGKFGADLEFVRLIGPLPATGKGES